MVDNGQIIIKIRQFLYIGPLAFPAGLPLFIQQRASRNNQIVVHIFLKNLLEFIKFQPHPGSFFPFPTNIINQIKIFIAPQFDQDTIGVALDNVTVIFQPFYQVKQKKLTANTHIVCLPGIIHGIVAILHSSIGAVQNNFIRLLHRVLFRLQLQAGVVDFIILGRVCNIPADPPIPQHQGRVIGRHINIDIPPFPKILGNGSVKPTPSEYMGNTGHINFKRFGIVPVQRIFIPVQNLCIAFNPQGVRKFNFKFIIVIPLNGSKDFGRKLGFGSANIGNGKVESFHK